MAQRQRPSLEELDLHLKSLAVRADKEGWRVADINFTPDAEQWPTLPESLRKGLWRVMAFFHFLEERVTEYLAPILIAAPTERDRRFLAFQLGDEARHNNLFDKLREVFSLPEGLSNARVVVGEGAAVGFFRIFDRLQEAVCLLGKEPSNRRAWALAILSYHLIVEGFIAHGAQSRMLNFFKAKKVLPGMQMAFEKLHQDEKRHIAWGVAILELCVLEDPELAAVLVQALLDLAEPLVSAVVDPDLLQPARNRPHVPDWRYHVLDALAHRLGVIGIGEEPINDVVLAYGREFGRQWDIHQQLHGVMHAGQAYHLSRSVPT